MTRRTTISLGLVLSIGLSAGWARPAGSLFDVKTPETARTVALPLQNHFSWTDTGFIGIPVETDGGGNLVARAIAPNSPAASAGVKPGDVISSLDGQSLKTAETFRNLIRGRHRGQSVKMGLVRGGQAREVEMVLSSVSLATHPTTQPMQGREVNQRPRRFDAIGPSILKKDVLRLAVIGVEFADVHHNPKIDIADWDAAFFSRDTYVEKDATGRRAYGSVNDFYRENSSGAMQLNGKVFEWVELSKRRMEYYAAASPSGPDPRYHEATYDSPLLNEVLDQFFAREGNGALDRFDAVLFLYAGSLPVHRPDNVFWPHTTQRIIKGRRMRYVIAHEGGRQMTSISLFCHELGHVLGLPDLYATHRLGDVAAAQTPGVGLWCLMANQMPGRPQHMSAWCKEKLGWIKPAIIDPSVRQQLVLAPIENSPRECFKIPLKWDGSEYLLLENRRHIGFDASLPAQGLLIWHVSYNRPVLVEAHGLGGPQAAWLNYRNIPYPTPWNSAYTPFSRPSSVIESEDGIPIYITDITRLEDGRILFTVGDGFD